VPRRVRFHVSQSSAEAEALSRESRAGVRGPSQKRLPRVGCGPTRLHVLYVSAILHIMRTESVCSAPTVST
jgi:hypothetical protein